MHLRYLNTRCLACVLEGLDPFEEFPDRLVKESGRDLARLCHRIGSEIDINIEVNGFKTAGLDVFKGCEGVVVIVPTAALYANFKHSIISPVNFFIMKFATGKFLP